MHIEQWNKKNVRGDFFFIFLLYALLCAIEGTQRSFKFHALTEKEKHIHLKTYLIEWRWNLNECISRFMARKRSTFFFTSCSWILFWPSACKVSLSLPRWFRVVSKRHETLESYEILSIDKKNLNLNP